MAPLVPNINNINVKMRSRDIFDGSATRISRKYFPVRRNNRVSMPTHGQSRSQNFIQTSDQPIFCSDASAVITV